MNAIGGLPSGIEVDVRGTSITPAGVARLKRVLGESYVNQPETPGEMGYSDE